MSVAHQVLVRLRSLQAAGVEWLPKADPIRIERPVEISSISPIAPVDPLSERRTALGQLRSEVERCDKCPELFSTRTQTVFGVGPVNPDLCLIGEAPGAEEDKQGEPFVGPAGQLLTKIIAASGFRREDVAIINTLKCRPPRNATPTDQQCANCRPFLDRQLAILQPKVIACLGGVAAKNLLGVGTGITRLRGQWQEYRGTPVICTYHPSYLKRLEGTDGERKAKGECWDDFKAIVARLGRSLPGQG